VRWGGGRKGGWNRQRHQKGTTPGQSYLLRRVSEPDRRGKIFTSKIKHVDKEDGIVGREGNWGEENTILGD